MNPRRSASSIDAEQRLCLTSPFPLLVGVTADSTLTLGDDDWADSGDVCALGSALSSSDCSCCVRFRRPAFL